MLTRNLSHRCGASPLRHRPRSPSAAKPKSGYVDVKWRGTCTTRCKDVGDPLIMLHGGVNPDQFGPNIEALAKTHMVITVHLQGHGQHEGHRSPVPLSRQLADDIAAVRRGDEADERRCARSLVRRRRRASSSRSAIPQLVRQLVIVSEVMKRDGWYPEVVKAFEAMAKDPKKLALETSKSPLAKRYLPNVDFESGVSARSARSRRSTTTGRRMSPPLADCPSCSYSQTADAVRADPHRRALEGARWRQARRGGSMAHNVPGPGRPRDHFRTRPHYRPDEPPTAVGRGRRSVPRGDQQPVTDQFP